MFNKVKEVEPLQNYVLLVTFENGVKKYYDLNPLFKKWKVFCDLINISGLYNNVKVDAGGYGISWNDNIDLSSNELWENGKEGQWGF